MESFVAQMAPTQITQSCFVIGHLIKGRKISGLALLLLLCKELVLRPDLASNSILSGNSDETSILAAVPTPGRSKSNSNSNSISNSNSNSTSRQAVYRALCAPAEVPFALASSLVPALGYLLADHERNRLSFLTLRGLELGSDSVKAGFEVVRSACESFVLPRPETNPFVLNKLEVSHFQ